MNNRDFVQKPDVGKSPRICFHQPIVNQMLPPAAVNLTTHACMLQALSDNTKIAATAQKFMKAPEQFEVLESYSCYRLSGHGQLAEAARMVIKAIAFSRSQGIRRLLIDTTQWTGHMSPGTLERYEFAQIFAEAAGSAVKLAMVVRPEMMDPEKFEVTVARNRGLIGNVFDSEKDALAWLLDPAV